MAPLVRRHAEREVPLDPQVLRMFTNAFEGETNSGRSVFA